MLEILAVYYLCKQMGAKLRAKGWTKPIWMQVAVAIVWFGCEFFGSFCYALYIAIKEGDAAAREIGFAAYPVALLSAAAGVGLLFLIVRMLPSKVPPLPSSDNLA